MNTIVNVFDKKLAFYQGRKTGCITIMAWITLANFEDLREKVLKSEYEPEIAYSKYTQNIEGRQKYIKSIKFLKEKDIPDHTLRFCVVRDPIKRFISAYNHMILSGYDNVDISNVDQLLEIFLHKKKFLDGNDPQKVKNHFKPMTDYYGKDSSKFYKIFNINNMKEVHSFLEDYSNTKLPYLTMNISDRYLRGNPPLILNKKQLAKVQELYKEDYAIYGKWL